jgi:hypothetical protein
MNIVKKRRRVKDSMRKQYQMLQQDKKRQVEESKMNGAEAQQVELKKVPSS